MEDDFGLVECMWQQGGAYAISPACRPKAVIRTALDAFLSVFDGYTLADIAGDRAALLEQLDLRGRSSDVACCA